MAVSGDRVFGPQYNSESDFTLTFEHLVLTIIPASLLVLVTPFNLRRYLRNKHEPEVERLSEVLLIFRLVPAAVLFILDAISIGFWSAVSEEEFRSGLAFAAAGLSCLAAVAIGAIVFVEYRHCLRTSAVLSMYLSFGLVVDIIKARTCLSRTHLPGVDRIGVLCAVGAAAKLILAVLEEVPKSWPMGGQKLRDSVGSESLSGFWNRSLFIWLNSTLSFGFRNVLNVCDLENLGPDLSAAKLHAQFRAAWKDTDKTSRFCLIKACMCAFWESFFLIPIPRLFFLAFNFSQPFLLQRILVSIREDQDLPVDVQNGLIAATVVIFFGAGVSKASFTHLTYRFIARLRNVLVQEIYNKTLLIPQYEAERHAAVTLMSTEIDVMILGLAQFHEIWSAFVEIAIGTWLLTTIVAKISYFIIPMAIVSTAVAYELGRRMGPARGAWNEYIQLRVAKTANVLSQTKPLKMLGLSSTLSNYLQRFRVQEIVYTKMFRKLTAIMVGSSFFLGAATPIIILAGALFWTTFDRHLDADEVFPMMTILYLVEEPLENILNYYPNVMSTMACIRRMQDFILLEEIQGISPAEAARASRHSDAVEKEEGTIEVAQRRLRAPLPTTEKHVVQFFSASIAPEKGKPIVLSAVNINIERHALAMVASTTGGGKTTFLRAVTGGAEVTTGSMHVDPRMAYCAQDPWIQNDTICKNIISRYMFDPVWYDAVVKACLLLEDFSSFPGGDQFLAGSNGSSLSGGQKHRVALARAVYARAEVIVLDDILASLDRRTAAAVFCGLFGANGILKKTNSTVIMATSTTADYLDLATDVIYIHQDGTVTTHTNSKRPNLSDAALFKLLAQADLPEEDNAAKSRAGRRSVESTAAAIVDEEKDALRQGGSKGLYRFYLKSVGWTKILIFMVLTLLLVFSERLPRIFIRIWIDIDPDDMRFFIPFALLGVVTGVISATNLYFYWFFFVPESAQGLHKMLADVVMRAKFSFLTATDSGTILNRFSQDMNLLTQELPVSFWKCLYCLLLLILDVSVLVSGVSYAAASIPFLIAAVYIVQTYYLRTSRQLRFMDLEAKSPLYTHFTETAAGLEHIRCFGWQDKAMSRNIELLEYSQKPFYYMYTIQRWLTLIMDMTSLALATTVVIIVLRVKGVTTPAGFGLTFLNVISLGNGMTSFIERWTDIETSLGAIARLRSFLKMTPVEKSQDDCDSVPEDWPQHGHIVMNHVSANYRETDDRHVLQNVSANFQPGKKAAIIGRTGSGKSTIIATILNLLDYTGSIQIDGIELSRVAPDTLRSRVTTIAQDRIRLDSSVRDNIIPEEMLLPIDERTDNSVIYQALGQVGLSDHFRGRLDTSMVDIGLSAGQQQQFNIARAIIHHQRTNSKIVLMDEPTSSLGFDEDAEMQDVMARVFSQCTVVTVTHRVEAVHNRQIVVELENGRVAGYVD